MPKNPDKYTIKLENIIKQMLNPLKSIPFSLVIEGLSNRKVIPFNNRSIKDNKVLKTLKSVAKSAGRQANKSGIKSSRANEVGNYIESYIIDELNKVGFSADIPKSASGKKKSTGYPDIYFKDSYGRGNYLECKTFNFNNVTTTQRSFYLSPSKDFKITEDARHFVISFETYLDGRYKGKNVYRFKRWKLLSLENLDVDVKYEFNSDNARLYAKEHILAEGKF